jgi:hypothetical protein
MGISSITMEPSGRRTAIAFFSGPIIINPSISAWPPMVVLRLQLADPLFRGSGLFFFMGQPHGLSLNNALTQKEV